MLLGGYRVVWTGLRESCPERAIHHGDLAGGREGANDDTLVDLSAVDEVLRTGLFVERSPGEFAWAHQTFAEFLAADWIRANNLPERSCRALLQAPMRACWPQTRLVATWLAAIEPSRYGFVIVEDPESYVGAVDVPEQLRPLIVDGLLATAERIVPWQARYERLNHPGIAEQLRTVLQSGSTPQRHLALEVARGGGRIRSVTLPQWPTVQPHGPTNRR